MTVERATRAAGAAGALRVSPFFRGLPEPWLRRLQLAAASKALEAGEVIELEGGSPRLYLLTAGEIAVSTLPDAAGVAELVGHETPGGAFGSRQITGEEDPLVYRAVGPAEVQIWELAALEQLFAEEDGLRRQLETRLSSRRRRSELVDLLRRTPLFRQAGQSLVRWLVASSTLAWFESGSEICRQGEPGDSMFLIVSGEVAFFQDGAADLLRQLYAGDFFGEIALVRESVRSATAVASTDAEILIVGREAFEILYRRASAFREAMRSTAALRLEADRSGPPEPELVLLVNDTAWPTEQLATLVVDALRDAGVAVAEPHRLDGEVAVPRDEGAAYVVCFADHARTARSLADDAGCVVQFSADAASAAPPEFASLHHVHVVVSATGKARAAQPFRRDTFPLTLPRRLQDGMLPSDARRVLQRVARAIARRRVGVALGGGAAWGYAHVALLRGLERARIPVDVLVGASAGSLVGAFYASRGLRGLDRLVAAKLEVAAAAFAAIGTTSSLDLLLRRHIPQKRVEELPLPFATVAVEADTGREKVFRHGSLATAVRASCSLPGIFGRPLLGGDRYLDACVRHNVPVGYCTEADADFVIACDVVPAPTATRPARGGVGGRVLELLQVNRLTDTVRSLYWLASTSGELQAGLADALFAPDLSAFAPWDFHRADAIVERAEAQLDEWLAGTQSRYRALARSA